MYYDDDVFSPYDQFYPRVFSRQSISMKMPKRRRNDPRILGRFGEPLTPVLKKVFHRDMGGIRTSLIPVNQYTKPYQNFNGAAEGIKRLTTTIYYARKTIIDLVHKKPEFWTLAILRERAYINACEYYVHELRKSASDTYEGIG